MLHLLDNELSTFPHLLMLNTDMFDNDKELRELRQQRRQMVAEMDSKIRDRRQLLLQEHENNHPARYSRKYSSSYSNVNGKEKRETNDVIEENEDGAKTIHEKADTIEKDNGKVVDEEHVNVKLAQDKDDKNKWRVEHNGKTIVLDATDKDFGQKMQELTASSGGTRPQAGDENSGSEDEDDEQDVDEDVDEGDTVEALPAASKPAAPKTPAKGPKRQSKKARTSRVAAPTASTRKQPKTTPAKKTVKTTKKPARKSKTLK